jgi:hypothetical protein
MPVLRDVHVVADELPAPRHERTSVRTDVVAPPAPYPPAAWTHKLEDALARIVAHVEKRLDRLEIALATERRLCALEAGMAKGDAIAKDLKTTPGVVSAVIDIGEWDAIRHAGRRGGR